jgi:hypothetical protein
MGAKDLITGESAAVTEMLPADPLGMLAVRIRSEHQAAKIAARKTLEHALRAGELLLEAKALVGHGHWGDWLHDHCDVSERTAQGYMRLARNRTALASNPQSAADLTIDQALQALAKPSDSPDRTMISAVAEYLPASGRVRFGVVTDRGVLECLGVVESTEHPGYFHVAVIDFSGGWAWCKRPMRAEGVKLWFEYVMRNPALWPKIEWEDRPDWPFGGDIQREYDWRREAPREQEAGL